MTQNDLREMVINAEAKVAKRMVTLYAHNSKLLVQAGDAVEAGDILSLSGSTGRSTGPHLHFEVRINGQRVNPRSYLPT